MTEESLFAAALEKATPAERLAYLEEACRGDAGLLQRMKILLAAHEKARGILDREPVAPIPTTPDTTVAIGAVVAGRYKVLESLGEGGMGTVFVAEQTQPVRRKVALKIIKAGMDSQRILARFEAERQALALMDHPNIAKVLDGGVIEAISDLRLQNADLQSAILNLQSAIPHGRPFFVMEYIKGVPLTAYCDAARLTVRQRLELFLPVCQAVQHAHQKGIIHRDLKPSNILVALYDGKPVPKVIDFGLAKAMHQPLTERTLYTAHGLVMGTPLYMSPEQAELNNLDIDTRTDIYALGVILYELLTGATPLERGRFKKAAWDEILRIIREEEPPKPSTRLSGSASLPTLAAQRQLEPAKLARLLRGDLDWIVMKALDKDRNRRYETANGFGMDVQRYLAEEPVLAGPPTASYRLRKFLRRNRRPVLAASVLLVALVGGIAGTTWGLVRAVRAETEARQAEAAALADRDEKEEARAAEAEQRRQADDQRRQAVEQRDRAQKAEKETKEQADIARTVNDFLQNDLLGQADIGKQPLLVGGVVERNPNVTVRELLDRAARDIEGKFADQPLTEASIRLTIGDAYWALGRYPEAQQHLERSVQLRTAKLGADHPHTLTSKNNLAVLYQYQGQYAKAEPLLKEVLEARTAEQGADHPDTLTSKNNLAVLYKARGQYAKAEPLYKEVLEVRTAKLGADHPLTLTSKNNLAGLYQARGQYAKAEPLYKEVLEVRTAKLGADHPDTLASKNNLALLYMDQGQYAKAEPLYKEAIEASTAKLGANHPGTLTSKNNLAELYRVQRQYAKAEPLYKEVLETSTAKLGADHPDTLTSKNNLAVLYQDQGQYAKAEPLYKEVLETSTAKLGADHPDTLTSKNNLAMLYQVQGQYAKAEPLFKEVLETSTAKLGADHPHTLTSKNNLALLYKDQGHYARAEPLFKEVVEARAAKLGADHPNTLRSKINLAGLYLAQGQYAKAEPLFKEALEAASSKLGADHPLTLTNKNNLAALYQTQGQYPRAEPLFKEVLEANMAKLGADHPDTLNSKNNLAVLYLAQGQYAKAEPLFRQALDAARKKLGLGHPNSQLYIRNLYHCYDRMKAPEKAEPLLREWADFWKEKAGADSLPFAQQLATLGRILLQQQKAADAEQVLRTCLAIREKKAADEWTTFNTKSALGGALLAQKKYAAAEPLLLAGYEGMKQREAKIPPQGKIRLTEALERLVRLYEATDRKDEVKKWRPERAKYPTVGPKPGEKKR